RYRREPALRRAGVRAHGVRRGLRGPAGQPHRLSPPPADRAADPPRGPPAPAGAAAGAPLGAALLVRGPSLLGDRVRLAAALYELLVRRGGHGRRLQPLADEPLRPPPPARGARRPGRRAAARAARLGAAARRSRIGHGAFPVSSITRPARRMTALISWPDCSVARGSRTFIMLAALVRATPSRDSRMSPPSTHC